MTRDFHLRLRQGAPGDTVAVSGLVRDLTDLGHRVSVTGTHADQLFAYDSRVVPVHPDATDVIIDYRATLDASRTDRSRRYLTAAHDSFELETGIRLPTRSCRPHLVLNVDELDPPFDYPYAVIAAGSKSDIPLKQAPPGLFENVVRQTPDIRWKQVGRLEGGRIRQQQWAVRGTDNLLGQTDLRELMRLIYHAQVVLSHTSLPMLLASAFHTPCVVLGGGREDPWFFDDLGVTYLHTIGDLPCCATAGCRASYAKTASDVPYPPGLVCSDPVDVGQTTVGRCMTMITSDRVAAAVRTVARP